VAFFIDYFSLYFNVILSDVFPAIHFLGFRLNPIIADIDMSSNNLDGTVEFQVHCGHDFTCYNVDQ
jgi:hypothetical protein